MIELVTNKIRCPVEYVIIACVFLTLQGCLSPHARYTRPSYQKNKKDKPSVQGEKPEKETGLVSSDEIFESKLKRIVDSYMGVRYKYGGTTRKGMDCSGFVYRVYTELGRKPFPRTSSAKLSRIGTSVTRNGIRQGDLVFFRKGRRIDHVGIYMGDDRFAHASSKKGIMYTSLDSDYFRNRLICIRRVH